MKRNTTVAHTCWLHEDDVCQSVDITDGHFACRQQRSSCTRRRVKTEHLIGRSTRIFSRCATCSTLFYVHTSSNASALAQDLMIQVPCVSCVQHNAFTQSFFRLMSCRKLLGLPERRSTFPDGLETRTGIPCIDPGGGGWFGRMAKQSPLRRSALECRRSSATVRLRGRSAFRRVDDRGQGCFVSIPSHSSLERQRRVGSSQGRDRQIAAAAG